MKPRARASFCHWPKETSTPVGPGRARAGCRARRPARSTTSSAPGPARRRSRTAGSSSRRGTSPSPTDWRAGSSKRKKSWKAPASRVAPLVGRHAGQVGAVDQDARPRSARRAWHSSLTSVDLPAPFSPTMATTDAGGQGQVDVLEHQPVGARVGEATRARGGCPRRARSGTGTSASRLEGGGVVLQPGQPAGAVQPDARAGSRSRPRSRRCRRTGGTPAASTSSTSPGRGVEARGDVDDGADVGQRRTPPTPSVCQTALRPAGRGHRAVPAPPTPARRSVDQPAADAGDPHLLAGRRGGGRREQVARPAAVDWAPALLDRPLDGRPPGDGDHGRERRTGRAGPAPG